MKNIIDEIRKELKQNADEKTKKTGQNFFKEKIKLYGVKTAIVNEIGKRYFKNIKNKSKVEIFNLCEKLLQSGYLEEAFIAYNWAYYIHKYYTPDDFEIFEKWVNNYVSNWAECDTLSNHAIGSFILMFPEYVKKLKTWTKSVNRWVKRSSAVTLILPAKKGMFLDDIFSISDSLMTDADDLVQKGYGWMLKESSKQHQQKVFDYIIKHKKVMPRTALRYAIEKMPENLKKEAMKK
ncbi:DNA alkylation repair protein [Candidatus Desantisbacteria bacterium]|nr:DNA alkylation repair protein [Candidatus Desantisbacteria bacterium]